MEKSLAYALSHSEVLFERAQIDAAIGRLAGSIAEDYAGERPLFLTVMNGGMPFASLLALEIGRQASSRGMADLEFDYVHATRYRGDTTGAGLHWLRRPEVPLSGRRVLLVDDILDEGHTLAAIREWCRAEGAVDVRIAAMTVKRHDRCVEGLVADYVAFEVPDRYVFGFGMDYHERGRHLPAIHALID
ncbi:hypoxanthine-guanine phosphoribosyltransferase [Alkalisalibacterium limincola]|uniref:Hypoxanthine-guanine phosphoribosyltransferase n=1 Tax=Alkalisalibacterium limincola TaxID=2699169 RepID=A0A5C8KV33_9GAMM|nr:hypoxanthine-guanine phosphoribosyltransferase [Alkalisalibacterium limincola]TXK65854.1 hypoxanthine-guanine phosphoribosyltransferase [Alkalisalibacterium limincola]